MSNPRPHVRSGIWPLAALMALAPVAAGEATPASPAPSVPASVTGAAEQAAYLSRVRARAAAVTCYPADLSPEDLARIIRENGMLPPTQVFLGDERLWVDTIAWVGDLGQGPSTRAQSASFTYSFPADGTTWGLPAISSTGANTLNARLVTLWGNLDRGREFVRQALASWRRFGGLTYREVADDNSAMDQVTARSDTRGDIRVGGLNFGTSTFLAYNAFPSASGLAGVGGSDMCINTSFFTSTAFNQTANNYRYFRNTVAHEHGHGLGCIHSVPCNGTKMMEPQISTSFDVVQIDDRRDAGRNYGDRYSGNQSAATARNFGNLTSPSLRSVIERDMSTNGTAGFGNTDEDWYVFTLSSPQPVVISAAPTGGTYTAGQQSSSCSGTTASIAAASAGNLNIDLVASDGSTVLQTAASAAAGSTETLNAGTLAAGTYYVRVYDVGPNTAANQFVQLYDLTIRVASALAPPYANCGVNKRIAANTACYFIGNINSAATETGSNITAATGYDWDTDGDGVFDINDNTQPNRAAGYPSNGDYNVVFRLTDSNGTVATDTITVTVYGATASLSSVSPSSGAPGSTVPVTINGVNLKGLTSASLVTVSGTGVSVVGTPVPNVLGTQVTGLSFQIAPGATVGPRSVSVTNSDGSGTSSGDATLVNAFTVTTPPPPGAFNLISPADGAVVTPTPTFEWEPSTGATNYYVFASLDPGGMLIVYDSFVFPGTSVTVPPGVFSPGPQVYYWSVSALNAGGAFVPPARTFTVAAVPPPCLGDINNDGQRNTADLTIMLGNFGGAVPPNTGGDLDGNGQVNTADLTALLGVFGTPCP